MSRATSFLQSMLVATVLWLLALYHPGKASVPEWYERSVATLPLWAFIAFCAHSLASVGWSLMTFGECPEAHASLMQEIQEAKRDLGSNGILVD